MPSDVARVAGWLTDVIENIDAIHEFVGDLDYARFIENREKIYAVTRALEIISEASRHIPENIKARHGDIAWPQIKAAGNIYRHEYRGVDLKVVWDTIGHLDPLRIMAESELQALRS
jgi:uncharacterized protein with HEPN domain